MYMCIVCVCVCVGVGVCMYVCVCMVCMYARMLESTAACKCVHACMCVCVCVCCIWMMHACMCVCVLHLDDACMHVCVCVLHLDDAYACMCVRMYVLYGSSTICLNIHMDTYVRVVKCVRMYVNVYACMYTHTHTQNAVCVCMLPFLVFIWTCAYMGSCITQSCVCVCVCVCARAYVCCIFSLLLYIFGTAWLIHYVRWKKTKKKRRKGESGVYFNQVLGIYRTHTLAVCELWCNNNMDVLCFGKRLHLLCCNQHCNLACCSENTC
jgi:hypothetical protein